MEGSQQLELGHTYGSAETLVQLDGVAQQEGLF